VRGRGTPVGTGTPRAYVLAEAFSPRDFDQSISQTTAMRERGAKCPRAATDRLALEQPPNKKRKTVGKRARVTEVGRRQARSELALLAIDDNTQTYLQPITFKRQPEKSPDVNTLDLGIWYSLACGVRSDLKSARRPR